MGCCSGRCMLILLCCVQLYQLWMMLWISWNVFISCLYLDLVGLSKDSNLLSLGVSSQRSWWKDNWPGCERQSLPSDEWQNHRNPERTAVLSCWFEYQYMEVLHCTVQLLISLLGLVMPVMLSAYSQRRSRAIINNQKVLEKS